MFAFQNAKPFFVTIEQEPARSTTVADLFLGVVGIFGVLVLLAACLGAVLGLGLVLWNRRRPAEADHMPSVSPQLPISPPSSPTR